MIGAATTMTEETFYTIKEIADLLRVHPRTVRKMIAEGEIEAIKVRDEYRIRHSALDAFIRKGRSLLPEDEDKS
jgi:excisionase family DNA binding protein